MFIKASWKLLEPRRNSSSLLDLLGSENFKDKPVQLQLHLTRAPMWGQDVLLMLLVRRVPVRDHVQGPVGLTVRFCAQALLHGGSTRKPFWRHVVHLNVDSEKGKFVAGIEVTCVEGALGLWVRLVQSNHVTENPSPSTHRAVREADATRQLGASAVPVAPSTHWTMTSEYSPSS